MHEDAVADSNFTVAMSEDLRSLGSVEVDDGQTDDFITPGPSSDDYERFQSRGTRSPSPGGNSTAKRDQVQCSDNLNAETFTEQMVPKDQVEDYDIYGTGDTPEPSTESAVEPVVSAVYTQVGSCPFLPKESKPNGRAKLLKKETTEVASNVRTTAVFTKQGCTPYPRTPGMILNPRDRESATVVLDHNRSETGQESFLERATPFGSTAEREDVLPDSGSHAQEEVPRTSTLAAKAYEFLARHRRS